MSAASPIAGAPVTIILPVRDMERARAFYQQRPGLTPRGQTPDGKFAFSASGVTVALMHKPEGTKAEHTALSFEVTDITAAIGTLKERGVVFSDYDLPGFKTVAHVCVLGSEKAAWFNDPEGNILCLHEPLPA